MGEMIIAKLDAEFCETKTQLEKEVEQQVLDMQQKLDAQKSEMGACQQSLQEQVERERATRLKEQHQQQGRIAELEAELDAKNTEAASRDGVIQSQQAEIEALRAASQQTMKLAQLESAQEVQRYEMKIQEQQQSLKAYEKDLNIARNKLAAERVSHKEAIGTLKASRAKELEGVSQRVRLTIEKKDSTIRGLQQQIRELEAAL